MRKDLLDLRSLSKQDIELILDTADACKEILSRPVRKVPTLRGKVLVNLFYEASTRTRMSFEMAGKCLSADVMSVSVATSSVTKGESIKDTVRTVEALGADFVVIRHSSPGVPHLIARTVRAGVINAGDGTHEHPTQGLLDAFTIRERLGSLAGRRVLIVGDILHSRVARSDIWALTKLGARVAVCGPATLLPPGLERFGVKVYTDLDEALPQAEVIQVLRVQLERQKGGLLPSLREYSRRYGINKQRLDALGQDVVLMHPGPANLGVEITEVAAEDRRSVIRDQVRNGVAVRMAVLYLLSGGDKSELAD
ncbi:MAG: aspartate carbamoyltransferase catalytic subunit [Firmicutes bacterium]|jgi:aspartate carbamoyltransferase catalytic subunit|nr:aspartate carbamoyltransferase catalytic subunit [Bacillota bacterium]